MEWKDETRHGEIIASIARVGGFRISVHHYMGCGESWFVSCDGIFDKRELGEMTLNQAQAMALAKLQLILEEAIKAITG